MLVNGISKQRQSVGRPASRSVAAPLYGYHRSMATIANCSFLFQPAPAGPLLEMTNLHTQFEIYDSAEEAITAAYLGSRYSRGKGGDARPRVLCLFETSDVRTFLQEVLFAAGYNAMATGNIDDAKILLKATKAKVVVVSAHLQSVYGRPTRKLLEEIDPAISFFVLDEEFATQDPGEAARKLLSNVGGQ